MSPKNYRPFPQYPIAKDFDIAFVRFVRGADGVIGQWKSASGLFESADGQIKCDPAEVVEWRPMTIPPPPYIPVVVAVATTPALTTIFWNVTGGSNPTVYIQESTDGGATFFDVSDVIQRFAGFDLPDPGELYRVRVADIGMPDVFSDTIAN